MGSLDHTRSSRAAVRKSSSSLSLSESAVGRGISLKVRCLQTTWWIRNSTCLFEGFADRWVLLNLYSLQGWRRFQLPMIQSRCRLIWWAVLIGHSYHHFYKLHHGSVVIFQIWFLRLTWTKLKDVHLPQCSFKQHCHICHIHWDLVKVYCRFVCTSYFNPIAYLPTALFQTLNNLSSCHSNGIQYPFLKMLYLCGAFKVDGGNVVSEGGEISIKYILNTTVLSV